MQKKILSLLVFDIPPKISILCKNNFPFFESFTLTKIRIELSCYLTNLAKSGPEKKMFCKFCFKIHILVQACKKLFYQKSVFLISFHKNGPIKKSPRVITDIIILEVHTRGFLIFFNFVGANQVLVFSPTFLDQSVEHLLAWDVNLSHTNVNLLNTKLL